VKLTRLRTQLNEYEENYNEKKKKFKFEIQLAEEREALRKIDGMDDEAVEMVDLDEIGIGRGKLQLGPDGKPQAYNLYGASNADKNFVQKFTTQTQIAEQQKKSEEEKLKKQTSKGSQAQWYGKMNFSLPYMKEFQR